jgi:hypothetical protein
VKNPIFQKSNLDFFKNFKDSEERTQILCIVHNDKGFMGDELWLFVGWYIVGMHKSIHKTCSTENFGIYP